MMVFSGGVRLGKKQRYAITWKEAVQGVSEA